MRRWVLVCCTLSAAGCADILGIPDRFYDGGAISEAGSDVVASDAPSDGPGPDGSTSCGTCTANGANCEVIACHQDTPTAVTIAGSRVFWANSSIAGSNNAVMSADVTGGAATVAYSVSTEIPALVTLQGTVYASTFYGGAIVQIPGDGGAATPVVSKPNAYAIGVDPINDYFAYGTFENAGSVWFCGAPDQCSTDLEVVNNQPSVGGVAVDVGSVYWSASPGGVFRCSFLSTCNSPTKLAASSSASLVAVDSQYVYWVDGLGPSNIWRANKTDGSGATGIAAASSGILAFVVDGGYVYYASIGTGSDGKITRVKIDGTGSTDLATGLVNAAGVAVDATHAYFTEWGPFVDGSTKTDGRVMRVPR